LAQRRTKDDILRWMLTSLTVLCLLLGGCSTALTRAQLRTASDEQLAQAWLDVGDARPGEVSFARRDEWPSVLAYREALRAEALSHKRKPDLTVGELALIARERPEVGMPKWWVWWMWGPPYDKYTERSPLGEIEVWRWGTPQYPRTVSFLEGRVYWFNDAPRPRR